ncbi:MAG: hypothetical protein WCE78_11265 [Pseudonocardiaceae bacterium]
MTTVRSLRWHIRTLLIAALVTLSAGCGTSTSSDAASDATTIPADTLPGANGSPVRCFTVRLSKPGAHTISVSFTSPTTPATVDVLLAGAGGGGGRGPGPGGLGGGSPPTSGAGGGGGEAGATIDQKGLPLPPAAVPARLSVSVGQGGIGGSGGGGPPMPNARGKNGQSTTLHGGGLALSGGARSPEEILVGYASELW